MRHLRSLLALSVLVAGPATLLADAIPYANTGTVAPAYTLTATATGTVTGFFYSSSAADTDVVSFLDLSTGSTTGPFFNNQTTAPGTSATFGSVNKGDVLVVEIYNQSLGNIVLSSYSNLSADGLNHAYITPFSGGLVNGVNVPAGLYFGMEDLPKPGSDFDYNDSAFIVTNVTATPVPEPSSLILLGSGLLGAAGAFRRRLLSR